MKRLAVPVLVLAALALPAAPASAADPTGVPAGAPDAARRTEPVLPTPPAWAFGESWSRTSGAGRLGGGASFWTDWVHDDHGAALPGGLTPTPASLTSNLAPTQGAYDYPVGPASANGADIFRSAVGADASGTSWRVDWNTLVDPAVPIAVWGIDLDDDPATGTATWPGGAAVRSPGQDRFLVVSSRGARLLGGASPVDLPVAVDLPSRSFVVEVPRTALPLPAASRLRLVSGLADAAGTGFAQPLTAGLPLAAGARVYNATFRTAAQEPPVFRDGRTASLAVLLGNAATSSPLAGLGLDGLERFVTGNFWMEDHQADALASGDVTPFSLRVDWSRLAARAGTPDPLVTGYSNRWYVSREPLGQGTVMDANPPGDLRPNYLGRIQPYAVQVPVGTKPGAPLTWVLHSLGVNHNQYGALNPRLLKGLCDDRGSICASTLGRGPDGWYFDEAEADFWQVWREVAEAFRPSTERTTISGYSMGGWATWKLGLAHPDLFASTLALEGPPACGIVVEQDLRVPGDLPANGRCATDGVTAPLLENARWLPYAFTQGVIDQLVPFTSNLTQQRALDALGYRHHFELYPLEDHLLYAVQDRFDAPVAAVGRARPRTVDPGHITHRWFPHLTRADLGIGATTAYWVSGLRARSDVPGTTARVDARSLAIPDPAVTVQRATSLITEPTPGTATDLTWRVGARPAGQQRLVLALDGVAALSVDAKRAGLSCGARIDTTSDGPATLRVAGRTLAVPSGTSTRVLPCASAKPAAPTPVEPGVASGPLAATGPGPYAAVLGLGLLLLAAGLRRRSAASQ